MVSIDRFSHLAVQFAAKMGYEVVVFPSTEPKREEVMKLDARQFYSIGNGEAKTFESVQSVQPNYELCAEHCKPSCHNLNHRRVK